MWWKQSKTFFFRWPRQFVLRKNSYQNTKQNMIRPENGPGGGDTLLNTKQSKQIEFFKLNRIQSTNYNYNTTHTYTHTIQMTIIMLHHQTHNRLWLWKRWWWWSKKIATSTSGTKKKKKFSQPNNNNANNKEWYPFFVWFFPSKIGLLLLLLFDCYNTIWQFSML